MNRKKYSLLNILYYTKASIYFFVFMKRGIVSGNCRGNVCFYTCVYLRIDIQTAQHHKPHMRLEVIDGILHHRLIFTETPVNPSDCVIYNDGHYSSGCNRDDLKAFVSF